MFLNNKYIWGEDEIEAVFRKSKKHETNRKKLLSSGLHLFLLMAVVAGMVVHVSISHKP